MILGLGYAVVPEGVHDIARWKIASGQRLDVKCLIRNHMPKLQQPENSRNMHPKMKV